jgi:ABC-type sugar transport system permease subunit
VALAQDEIFWRSVRNTITWASISPLAEVSAALILALALYAKVPGARFFRVAWFTPVLMSYIVVGILWVWIYNFDWGPVNAALRAIGLAGWAKAWLGNPNTALPSLIAVTTWMWIGFNMVVLLAALHSLPKEVIEAAELDNCGWAQKFVYVILPLIWPTVLNLIVLSFIGKMKIFDLVWITTRGGPLWSTETVSTYVYKRAFEWSTFDLGYPSTIATVWFVIVLTTVLTLTLALRQRSKLEY